MKSVFIKKILWGIYFCYCAMAFWVAITFPFDLILDFFWIKVDQAAIQKKEVYDGSLAGLPAGKGVTELTDIDQFYGLQMKGYDSSNREGWWDVEGELIVIHPEYVTFETDSIIPLGLYRLNSKRLDGHSSGRVSNGQYLHSVLYRPEYTQSKRIGSLYIYNQYYLVRLPDGNYVPVHLDDANYIKYCLAGKVQLPLGVATTDIPTQFSRVQPILEAYGVSDERILDMYCEKRYIDLWVHYAVFSVLAWPALMFIGAYCGTAILRLVRHIRKKVH